MSNDRQHFDAHLVDLSPHVATSVLAAYLN